MAVSEGQQLFASNLAYVDLDIAYAELSENSREPVTLKAAFDYIEENGSFLSLRYKKGDAPLLGYPRRFVFETVPRYSFLVY